MAKILVADDQLLIRVLIREILESVGHEIVDVDDGNKVISHLSANHVDLIITDIVMPNKEGLETIIEVTNDYPEIPILAMSGDTSGNEVVVGGYLEMARDFGANNTLQKPIEKDQLIEAVNQLLKI